MSEREISTWYRSVLRDGTLWCESSDPAEVVRMTIGKDAEYQKIVFYEVTAGWQEWTL